MDLCFEPAIWPEDAMPREEASYGECEVCTGKSRIVWGEGNPAGDIVIILDNPGAREDKDGNEYICGTRETLQTVLNCVGIVPENVYLTYLLKCRPLRKYNKEEARAFSKPFLERQIETLKPKLIICLGDVVVQTMFDDKEAHVKNLRGRLHTVMGYPCIVSYHPLAVRRRPNLMRQFMADWELAACTGLVPASKHN